ncbi:MAG: GH3 auxin-responsive promoter family protein [Candidatus Omnitrophica bacterium]|nr:GH3 auxin-responsive promoter family protein [Candidatus Omnitrophota bacterium]
MAVAPFVIKAYGLKAKAFERATEAPYDSQLKFLLELVVRNKNTTYGREHGFVNIRSVEDYRASVPVNDYESLRPNIERSTRGEPNVLTADKPILFGVTSGTTGSPKHIPVTSYSRRKKKDVMDVWTYYIMKDHPGLLNGKILAIVSPEKEGYTISKIPFGAESGHAYRNMPEIVKNLYALPYEVFEIKEYDAKYYCMLRVAMEKNVSVVASLNPSTILLLCQRIEKVKDRVIDDIRHGTLNNELNIRYDIRKKIESGLRPNPKRADELIRLSENRGGQLLPIDFWPGLEVIVCWKGGTVGIYISHFKKYFGDNISIRDFGYLSSEARASIPMCDEGCGGTLAIQGNFYEFVPKEEMDSPDKRFLLSHELEAGEEYYIILTTPGGLYRYNIDDIIKVVGFFNNTPMIEFKQKGSIVSSVTGEKIYESHINNAVHKATETIGVHLQFFSAFVEWEEIPRYAFLVEIVQDLPSEGKLDLLRNIEAELTKLNVEYETKRRSQRLDHPVLKIVPRGTFEEYRSRKIAEGSHDGQFKMPQLTSDLDFHKNFNIIEEIKV